MSEPLTRSQQQLRGKNIRDLTDAQIRDWIAACDKMERWVTAAKARRGWRLSRNEALAELARRTNKAT